MTLAPLPCRGVRRTALIALLSGLAAALSVSAVFMAAGAFDDDAPAPRAAAAPSAGTRADASALFRRARDGVVLVEARRPGTPLSFGRPSRDDGIATGTGFVVDASGHIVTNDHVAAGGSLVTVQAGPRTRRVRARIVGRDPSTDLALLRVDPQATPDLTPLPLGDSGDVRVGDTAVAVGNPFGLQRSLTVGVVSAVDRSIDAPDGFPIEGAVQTDAAINPGNSGGPLLDGAGRVIGVLAQSESGSAGIAYAVPVDTLRRVMPELRRAGRVARAHLGVATVELEPDLARTLGLRRHEGLVVSDVTGGSPADDAGVREARSIDRGAPRGGDVLLAIDGTELAETADLTAALERLRPGEEVELTVMRDGRRVTLEVELGRRRTPAP
jgi:S1-C subfamily serine protease